MGLPCRKVSALKHVEDLRLLGIDDFACVSEIASCIAASSPKLKTLMISLSPLLVTQGKLDPRPNVGIETAGPDDASMSEGEYAIEPPNDHLQNMKTATMKRLNSQRMSFLARILSLEPSRPEDNRVEKILKRKADSVKSVFERDVALLNRWKDLEGHMLTTLKESAQNEDEAQRFVQLVQRAIDSYSQQPKLMKSNKSPIKKPKHVTQKKPFPKKSKGKMPPPPANYTSSFVVPDVGPSSQIGGGSTLGPSMAIDYASPYSPFNAPGESQLSETLGSLLSSIDLNLSYLAASHNAATDQSNPALPSGLSPQTSTYPIYKQPSASSYHSPIIIDELLDEPP